MDPDEKIIEELKSTVKDNNKILKHMQRTQRWSKTFSAIKTLVFIALALGAYVVVQPILNNVQGAYQKIMGVFEGDNSNPINNDVVNNNFFNLDKFKKLNDKINLKN